MRFGQILVGWGAIPSLMSLYLSSFARKSGSGWNTSECMCVCVCVRLEIVTPSPLQLLTESLLCVKFIIEGEKVSDLVILLNKVKLFNNGRVVLTKHKRREREGKWLDNEKNRIIDVSHFKLVLSYGEHNLNHVLDPRGDFPGVKNRPQRLKNGVDASRAHFN